MAGAVNKLQATFEAVGRADSRGLLLRTLWNTPNGSPVEQQEQNVGLLFFLFFAPVVFLPVTMIREYDDIRRNDVFNVLLLPGVVLMVSIGAWFSVSGIVILLLTFSMLKAAARKIGTNQTTYLDQSNWPIYAHIALSFVSAVLQLLHIVAVIMLVAESGKWEWLSDMTSVIVDTIDSSGFLRASLSTDLSPLWTHIMVFPSAIVAGGFMFLSCWDIYEALSLDKGEFIKSMQSARAYSQAAAWHPGYAGARYRHHHHPYAYHAPPY